MHFANTNSSLLGGNIHMLRLITDNAGRSSKRYFIPKILTKQGTMMKTASSVLPSGFIS